MGTRGAVEILVRGEAVTLGHATPSKKGCCNRRTALGRSRGDLQVREHDARHGAQTEKVLLRQNKDMQPGLDHMRRRISEPLTNP